MPTANMKTTVKIKRGQVKAMLSNIEDILAKRLDAVSTQMVQELQTAVSKPGPSAPGNPPGITPKRDGRKKPGGLMRSIRWVRDGKLTRRIGTPLPRGKWMELGTRGGKIIRPTHAKALLVPITDMMAEIIKANRKGRHRTGHGDGGFAGLLHKNGQWYVLRRWIKQGPIAARPWLKPTFFKNLRRIGLTLGQKIN